MKRIAISMDIAGALFVALFIPGSAAAAGEPRVNKEPRNLHVPFVANLGQTDPRVKFYAKTRNGTVFVTGKGEIVYDLPIAQDTKAVTGWSLKEELIGAGIHSISGAEKATAGVSYFVGNDPSKWRSNVPTYALVTMGDVYEGISLTLRAYGTAVEKSFSVHPGAKPDDIRVSVLGANSLRINGKGELEAQTGLGTIVFTKPRAYQTRGGRTQEVEAAYAISGSSYGFRVREYDRTRELVIDPVIQATYLGGSGDDAATIAVSGSSVYVAGVDHLNGLSRDGGRRAGGGSRIPRRLYRDSDL